MYVTFSLAILAVIVLFAVIRQVNQYERGVMFLMGRFTGIKEPGWRIVIPVFQQLRKVDMRVKAVDVPEQKAITKDNISVGVNAVIYYKVADAAKVILEVEDFIYAMRQLAQTTMRNAVGEGEVIAAENLAKAANMLSAAPGALHLRTLQTVNDLSSDQSNTVVFALPLEVLRAIERVASK